MSIQYKIMNNIIDAINRSNSIVFPGAKPVRVVAQTKPIKSRLYICSLKFIMGPYYLDSKLSFFHFSRSNPDFQYGVAIQWPHKPSAKFTRITVNVETRADGRQIHHAEPDTFRLSSCHLRPAKLAKKLLSKLGFHEDKSAFLPTKGGFNLLAAEEVQRHISLFLQFALVLMCYRIMLGGKGRLRDHYPFLKVLGEKLDYYAQPKTTEMNQ